MGEPVKTMNDAFGKASRELNQPFQRSRFNLFGMRKFSSFYFYVAHFDEAKRPLQRRPHQAALLEFGSNSLSDS